MKSGQARLQHRPFLTPIWLTGIAAVLGLLFVASLAWEWGTADATTVIVIRDAPSASSPAETRIAALAKIFGGTQGADRLDAIYVLPAAQDSVAVASLAARLGISVTVESKLSAKRLARKVLRRHAGGRVVIIGGQSDQEEIVDELASNHRPPSPAEENGMDIITVPRIGHANLLRLNY